MTARWDFTGRGHGPALQEGATFTFEFEVKTGDPDLPASSYTAVNLTGYTAELKIRETGPAAGGRLVLEATTGNGRIAIDAAAGRVTVTIDADDTVGLEFERGVYALDLIGPGPSSVRIREVEGAVVYRRQVTR